MAWPEDKHNAAIRRMACSDTTASTLARLVKRFDRTGFHRYPLDPSAIENGASGIAPRIENDPLAIRAPDVAIRQDPSLVALGDLPCFGRDHTADTPAARCLRLPIRALAAR
jgi:hypothetical protein